MSVQTMLVVLLVAAPLVSVVSGCGRARTPEEEPTPQIRVVPGAASRSLWIEHGGIGHGAAGDAGADAGEPSSP